MNQIAIFLSLFLLFIPPCNEKKFVEIESILSSDSKDLEATKLEIETKLLAANFKTTKIAVKDEKLTVKSIVESERILLYNSLLQSNKLDIWNTYKVSDFEIQQIDPNKIKVDHFESFRESAKYSYPEEVIGKCLEPSKLKEILVSLKDSLSHLPNLKLVWSIKKEGIDSKEYFLYMINTKGRDFPPITEHQISESKVEEDSYTGNFDVYFSFNEQGTEIWSQLTQEAAYDGNRSLAITLNDRMYSCPSVHEPIYSGNCVLSGQLSKTDAEGLAYKIRAKRYSSDVQIETQTVSSISSTE